MALVFGVSLAKTHGVAPLAITVIKMMANYDAPKTTLAGAFVSGLQLTGLRVRAVTTRYSLCASPQMFAMSRLPTWILAPRSQTK